MKTKTKKHKISSYQKAIGRMEKETKRAIAHVDFLSKLYEEMKKTQKVS